MLTTEEKTAGRAFRSTMELRLAAMPAPRYWAPTVISNYRHLCPARDGKSTALELHEIYVLSPIYAEHGVPAGRFAYLWREGRCRGCGHVARSSVGRVVEAKKRPPLSGRVTRSVEHG